MGGFPFPDVDPLNPVDPDPTPDPGSQDPEIKPVPTIPNVDFTKLNSEIRDIKESNFILCGLMKANIYTNILLLVCLWLCMLLIAIVHFFKR